MNNVLVIGDVMLDCYYWCDVNKISPEAPVPVASLNEKTYVLGGAANVAANVVSLSGDCVLVGVRGKDWDGNILMNKARDVGITDYLSLELERPTTTKARIVAGGQHVLRIDNEYTGRVTTKSLEQMQSRIGQVMTDCASVVLSDYAKGVVDTMMAVFVITKARSQNIPVFVDPKGSNWLKFSNAFCVTPNLKEFKEFYNANYGGAIVTVGDACNVAPAVAEEYGWDYLVITMGADGILVAPAKGDTTIVPAMDVDIADVSGAGDTVIATFAAEASFIENPIDEIDMVRTAEYANAAAGVAVSRLGTVAVNYEEVDII